MPKPAMADYHRQDKRDYCGSATAMMILSDADVGISYGKLDQNQLFTEANKHSPAGWAVHPEGLAYVLNSFKDQFVVSPRTKREEVMGDVSAALDQFGLAPAVLLGGGWHWVAINELITKVVDGREVLKTVRIHDPWSPNSIAPKVHGAKDICKCRSNGHPNKDYPAKQWWNFFLRCVCNTLNLQQREFVSLIPRLAQAPVDLGSFIPGPSWDSSQSVSEDFVLDNFERVVERFGMEESLPDGANADAARFVECLTAEGRLDYYLVSLRRAGQIVGMASISAANGDLISIQRVSPGSEAERIFGLPELYEGGPRGVIDYILRTGRGNDTFRVLGSLRELEETVSVSSAPFWRDSPESRSEYLPFWRVSGPEGEIYVRLDGAVFRALTHGRFGE